MIMSAKEFVERINHCLDEAGAPLPMRERAILLSKILDISKQQAWLFLEGQQMPDRTSLEHLANEFEVTPQWLGGEGHKESP